MGSPPATPSGITSQRGPATPTEPPDSQPGAFAHVAARPERRRRTARPGRAVARAGGSHGSRPRCRPGAARARSVPAETPHIRRWWRGWPSGGWRRFRRTPPRRAVGVVDTFSWRKRSTTAWIPPIHGSHSPPDRVRLRNRTRSGGLELWLWVATCNEARPLARAKGAADSPAAADTSRPSSPPSAVLRSFPPKVGDPKQKNPPLRLQCRGGPTTESHPARKQVSSSLFRSHR